MKKLIWTLVILISMQLTKAFSQENTSLPYLDKDIGCISDVDAKRYVSDFRIDIGSFGGLELCRSEVDSKKLFNDLQIIEKGQFVASGQNKLIQGFVDSKNYYSWLVKQTRGVERGNDVPYATAYNRGGYFTMQDGWAKLSTLGRVGTFVHEARHTQGYRHIVCQQGPYQGTSVDGCDTNYNYGGSHAVEMEYYARVSVQGVNFHPVYKKMARLMAIARSNIFFNTTPIQKREAVLALNADRQQATLFDQGQKYLREVPQVEGSLKRTSYGAVLFNGIQALAIEMYQNSGYKDAVSDVYSYFKLLFENSKKLKDLEEFDSGIKRYVVAVTDENRLMAFDFPNGRWGQEQTLPIQVVKTTTAVPGLKQTGYFLVSNQGQIFSYQPETQRLVSQSGQWDSDYMKVIPYKETQLILRKDGKIYQQSGANLSLWSESAGQTYSDLVTVPMYDAFEVVKE